MHQSTGQQFDPAGVLAHRAAFARTDQTLNIELKPRLDKGKNPGRSRTVTSRLKIADSRVFMK